MRINLIHIEHIVPALARFYLVGAQRGERPVQSTDQAPSATQSPVVSLAHSSISVLCARLFSFGRMWAARHRAAVEIQHLYRATDLELRDLGLTRADIPAITRGTYRRYQ
jgi:uncharacterized protein YjiS (DUF1127 family)